MKKPTSLIELRVNLGSEDEFRIEGYKRNNLVTFIYYLLGVLSAGLLFLLAYWYPVKRFIYTHSACSLDKATWVLIKQFDVSRYFMSEIKRYNWSNDEIADLDWSNGKAVERWPFAGFEKELLSHEFRYFEHMFLRYYFR